MKKPYLLLSFILLCIVLIVASCSRHKSSRRFKKLNCPDFGSGSAYGWSRDPGGLSRQPAETKPLSGLLTASELNDFSKWELWTDVAANDLEQHQKTWQINPQERYCIQVKAANGQPLQGCRAVLLQDEKIIWQAITDNTGKAELWKDIFTGDKNKGALSAKVFYKEQEFAINAQQLTKIPQGINMVNIPAECGYSNNVDIMFTVDATSSMGDEIDYLKAELKDIIGKIAEQNPALNIHTGSLFYRCVGNSYTTRSSDFTPDITITTNFINEQRAEEGGEEAVEIAMDESVNKMSWRSDARAKLMFMVLDEPPATNDSVRWMLHKAIKDAAAKGIRIIPLVASGINYDADKRLEYLMRSVALATNGTYAFLTDHSGIGNAHTDPTTDEFDVELLNDLLVRVINSFTYLPDCNAPVTSLANDTAYVYNNKRVIEHVVLTESLGPQNEMFLTASADTTGSADVIQLVLDDVPADSAQTEENQQLPEEEFVSMKYYPNPTRGPVQVEIDAKNIRDIYVTDIAGKLLFIRQAENGRATIDLSEYPSGAYFIRCQAGERWFTGKVVVLR